MEDLLGQALNAYKSYQRAKQAFWDEIERRLHPVLEVLGMIIIAMPVVCILLWLLGIGE